MYQSSSSSSHKSTAQSSGGGLTRYGSAPGSLLKSAVDSTAGSTHDFSAVGSQPPPPNLVGHYFTDDSSSYVGSESTSCMVGSSNGPKSYGFNEIGQNVDSGVSSSSLFRQRSSPAEFFNHPSTDQNGFSLSRISEEEEESAIKCGVLNSMSIGFDSWDSSTSSIDFTIDRRDKQPTETQFFTLQTQTRFSQPQPSPEMARMGNFMHIPEDSVPCKIRAKRGCATHPRSIAERERRTRISGKLKKLQQLVPNMDKQTSYADMLDLAVDHIKGLQKQVQKLKKEMEKCTCDCKTCK